MKIVFFSDIHGNKYVLPSFLKAMTCEEPDKVIFCGDIFGYYYHQNEIIDTFIKNDFIMMLGNHDQIFLDILEGSANVNELIIKYGNSYNNIEKKISKQNINLIKTIKPYYEIAIDGLNIGVFHGSPDDPLNGRVYPDTDIMKTESYEKYDYVILGHTHHKMEKKINSTIILNPGSIGQQRDGKGCSYLVFDTRTIEYVYKVVKYPIDNLIEDIDYYDPGNTKLKEVLHRKANYRDSLNK